MKSFLIGLFGLTLFPAIGTVCWYTDHFGACRPSRTGPLPAQSFKLGYRLRCPPHATPPKACSNVGFSNPGGNIGSKTSAAAAGITPTSPASEKILKKLSFAFTT